MTDYLPSSSSRVVLEPSILKRAGREDSAGAECSMGLTSAVAGDVHPLPSVFRPFAGPSLWSGSAAAKAEVNRQELQDNLDGL